MSPGIEADEPDVLARSRESDRISVDDADISQRDRLTMCIGDHREKQRNKGERQQGDERAFGPEPERGPTAIIGRALVHHSAFRPRSRTASRIFAIRRFTAGKVCFGSNAQYPFAERKWDDIDIGGTGIAFDPSLALGASGH